MEFAAPAPVKRKRIDNESTIEGTEETFQIVKIDYDNWFPFP